MPDFSSVSSSPPKPIKMLYLGHTGAGKTGSSVALAAAGYNVRTLDLDDGIHIVENYIKDPDPKNIYRKEMPSLWTKAQADNIAERYSYVTITEGYLLQGARAIPKGDSWAKIGQQLNNWIDGPRKLGNISTWTDRDVLFIDGLSRLCESAMNFQLALNGRLEKGPAVGTSDSNDYSGAYRLITQLLDLFKSTEIKCHIIVACHIQFMVEQQADPQNKAALRDQKGFPQTVGRLISPRIGQYFNHALRAKSVGTGPGTRRVIVTNNDESIDLKNTAPLRVRGEYDLSTGLAEYFAAIRGRIPA